MQYVCEAGPKTWFRFETALEAAQESLLMSHMVEKFFQQAYDQAVAKYVPPPGLRETEKRIGLKAHVQKVMPLFLTLRDREGNGLATAMLPTGGKEDRGFRTIIVGPNNGDPFVEHAEAIKVLGKHFGLTLDPVRCYPYKRG